jgi:hypothetical protein
MCAGKPSGAHRSCLGCHQGSTLNLPELSPPAPLSMQTPQREDVVVDDGAGRVSDYVLAERVLAERVEAVSRAVATIRATRAGGEHGSHV